jgi:altronate dehydratase small subunit
MRAWTLLLQQRFHKVPPDSEREARLAKVIVLDESDNVATAIVDIAKGEEVEAGAHRVTAAEDIPFGHKIALTALAHGATILKYGESIGLAEGDIARGACVHVHNTDSQRGRGDRGKK